MTVAYILGVFKSSSYAKSPIWIYLLFNLRAKIIQKYLEKYVSILYNVGYICFTLSFF